MMTRSLRLLLSLALATTALADAQAVATAPTRVVVMPFAAGTAATAYQLGLPTALQRSLNEIPNLFAPPVGDVMIVMRQAQRAGKDPAASIAALFGAAAIVQGSIQGSGAAVGVRMTLTRGSEQQTLTALAGDGRPESLARAAARTLALALRPDLGASVLRRIDQAAAQTPSLPSLGPVGLAASRLPGASTADLATAAQLDPQSAWVKTEYARLLALRGDTKTAITVAEQATRAQPDDVEAQVVLGIVLQADNQQTKAAAAFQQALDLNPANAIALTGLARATKDKAKAIADLQAAIKAYPRMLDAYLQLASLQPSDQRALQTLHNAGGSLPDSLALHQATLQETLKMGDDQGALAYLQQAVRDPMASSAGLYSLARLLPADVIGGALALLRQGEKRYPKATILRAAEGELLLRQGDYSGAEGVLGPLHTTSPKDAGIANLLAVAQARQGQLEAARQTFESASGSGPNARSELARLYLAAGRAEAALKLLGPLVNDSKAPPDVRTLTYYGLALGRVGQLDQARAELKKALKLQPQLTIAQRGLSFLEQQRQLTGGKLVAFRADAGVAFQQGIYALEVQDYQTALQAFKRARKLDDNGLAAFFEGYALQLTGDPRAAVSDYQVALKSFPGSDIVLNDLGYAHLQLGRFDLALQQLSKAVKANPDNAQAHLNLGLTYYGLARYQDALGEFDQAVKLDPKLSSTVAAVRQQAQQKAAGR